ncbi:hypothetical protein ACFT9I_12955 [Streptomyces sp. NPDC057137]|uniref:hypothetical protein n=1 Tax=Streptomyces sp. NPDC057137 TaxID=3346030 RepID=UPI00363FE324
MAKSKHTWWLDGDLGELVVDGFGGTGLSADDAAMKARAQESLQHAEYRLDTHQNRYDLIDAVLALKRSMQTRLEHLDVIYGFKQYPHAKTHGWLGVLEGWGAVRQRMLRRMNRLRNAVEHDGADPPSLDECEDYREVVWWFLKATSPLLEPIADMDFIWGRARGSCDITYNPLRIDLRGNFAPEQLSDSSLPGWMEFRTMPALALKYKGQDTPLYVKEDGRYYVCGHSADWVSAQPFLKAALSVME